MRHLKLYALALVALALTITSVAAAAAPGATTGPAGAVTSTTATVTGTVSANKEQTTYHFEYGTTAAYGSVTPDKQAKGTKSSSVSAGLTTLTPSTTYHYRLVATNASGSAQGADMTFATLAEGQAPPGGNALTITATPASIAFGRATAISGQLTGPNSANVKLTLQGRPFPLPGAQFADAATGTTDASGKYSFATLPTANTEYQVVAKTKPEVTSPVQQVRVRFVVTLRVGDTTPQRGKRVRFSGRVRPGRDTALALIQRRASTGKFRTVAKALLKPSTTAGESQYSKRVRIRRSGVYRVSMPGDAQNSTGRSGKKRIRVH